VDASISLAVHSGRAPIRRGAILQDGELGKLTQYADGFVGLMTGGVALSANESVFRDSGT
jgi:hypothetical protein